MAWISSFKRYLHGKVLTKKASVNKDDDWRSDLSVEELRDAGTSILRHVQSQAFPDVVDLLRRPGDEMSRKKLMSKAGMSMFKLDPRLQTGGLLHAGGRIGNAVLREDTKNLVTLPYKHHFSDLVIQDHHVSVTHLGQESVLSSLRLKYWIIKARTAVRRIIRRFIKCQKKK